MKTAPPVDTGRASLLAAIRGFTKTKLKKKKHEDSVDTAGQAMGGGGGGGDLMSDLAAKLQMRRKGISGGAGKTSGDSGTDTDTGRKPQNPLDGVSKLIPPPRPKATTNRRDSHDDDWADS